MYRDCWSVERAWGSFYVVFVLSSVGLILIRRSLGGGSQITHYPDTWKVVSDTWKVVSWFTTDFCTTTMIYGIRLREFCLD